MGNYGCFISRNDDRKKLRSAGGGRDAGTDTRHVATFTWSTPPRFNFEWIQSIHSTFHKLDQAMSNVMEWTRQLKMAFNRPRNPMEGCPPIHFKPLFMNWSAILDWIFSGSFTPTVASFLSATSFLLSDRYFLFFSLVTLNFFRNFSFFNGAGGGRPRGAWSDGDTRS